MKIVVNVDAVQQAATIAIKRMGDFDDEQLERLERVHEDLDESIKLYETAYFPTIYNHHKLNPYFKNFWFNKDYKSAEFIVKEVLYKEYLFLFDDAASAEIYIDYRFTKHHSNIDAHTMSLSFLADVVEKNGGIILTKLKREQAKYNKDKEILNRLAKVKGKVILNEEEYKLIEEWL